MPAPDPVSAGMNGPVRGSARAHAPARASLGQPPATLFARVALAATPAAAVGAPPLTIYALGVLAPAIMRDLNLASSQLGMLATLPILVAIPSSPVAGRLVDRFGIRQVFMVLFGAAAAALLLVASASGLGGIVAGVCVAGVALAISNPVANRAVSSYVPLAGRGLAMGVKQSGSQISQFLVGASLPVLAQQLGWRLAASSGLLLIAGLGLLAWVVLPPNRPAAIERSGADASVDGPRGTLVWLSTIALLLGIVTQSVSVYLVLYAYEAVGMPLQRAGLLIGLVGGLGAVSRVALGRLTGRWPVRYLLIGTCATASLALVLIIAGPALGGELALWTGTALYAMSGAAGAVVVMVALVNAVPPQTLGRATARLSVAQFTGFAVGPLVFGAMLRTGSYVASWCLLVAASALAAVLGFVWTVRRRQAGPATT